jgi:hypothetical protein
VEVLLTHQTTRFFSAGESTWADALGGYPAPPNLRWVVPPTAFSSGFYEASDYNFLGHGLLG